MKKQLVYLAMILSCLTLTMTSCGDKEGDLENGYNYILNNSYTTVSSEGGTVDVVWNQGIVIYDNVYTAPWKYGPDNAPTPDVTSEESWEKVNTTIEKDILTGEGIVIVPVGSKVEGRYPGVRIFISPNTTGKKRCFRVFGSILEVAAYIFQDCEEPEE